MDWNHKAIETKITLTFKHPELLFLALSHHSYAQASQDPEADNERLEALGETIISLAIADYLYHQCPYLKVTNYKGLLAKLTEPERRTQVWFKLGLGDYPFLMLKEERTLLRQKRDNPFESGFEALVGAIHLDRGFAQTRNWLAHNLIDPLLKQHLKDESQRLEPKAQLKFFGNYLFEAIVFDYLYRLLPGVSPNRLKGLERDLTNKLQVEFYQEASKTKGNFENLAFKEWLGKMYEEYSEKNRNPFKHTQDWFVTTFLDQEEILRRTINLLLKDGKPQKWIIRTVLGYESKDYQVGRDRFNEILEIETKNTITS